MEGASGTRDSLRRGMPGGLIKLTCPRMLFGDVYVYLGNHGDKGTSRHLTGPPPSLPPHLTPFVGVFELWLYD